MSEPEKPAPETDAVGEFTICLENQAGYEFAVRFDNAQLPNLLMDEPLPLGSDRGPNATRFLAAAIGNCLSASLLFCARKARLDVTGVSTSVRTRLVRNEQGRIRIGSVRVEIEPRFGTQDAQKAARCLALFEDFCTVTQSVRSGIQVDVDVKS